MTPRQHLETQQALFKQFAEILDFTLKFDDLKVRRRYTNTKKLVEMNPKVGVKAFGLFKCLKGILGFYEFHPENMLYHLLKLWFEKKGTGTLPKNWIQK